MCVAPNCLASTSFDSATSTATIGFAPAIAAPWITFRPTPPVPITITAVPGSTLAVLNTAPTPVITPHETSAARSSGMSLSIFTRLSAASVAYSAITPQAENTFSELPLASRVGVVPSGSV